MTVRRVFTIRIAGVLLLFLLQTGAFSYNRNIDSLIKILPSLKDTNLLNTLNLLGNHYQIFNIDSSLILYNRAIKEADIISSNSSNESYKAIVMLKKGSIIARKGLSYFNIGDYENAEMNYKISFKICNQYLNSDNNIIKTKAYKLNAILFTNMGNLFNAKANYPMAINYFLKALRTSEQINNKAEIAKVYSNLGLMYFNQSDLKKAEEYFDKAIVLSKELGIKQLEANTYGNLANVYNSSGRFSEALLNFDKAYKISESINDIKGMQLWQGNIGFTYDAQKQPKEALHYFLKALELAEYVMDKNGISAWKGSVGSTYIKLGDYKKAEQYIRESLSIAEELDLLFYQQMLHQNLSDLYDKSGNYAKSLVEYKKFISIRDSINNDENIKQQTRLEMNYENDKKMAIAKAEQDKKDALLAKEKQKQRIILISVALGLLIISFFSLALYRRFKLAHKQKGIIEKQKHQVDEAYEKLHEKNKEVLDSIRYAARIQRSLITNEKYIGKFINRSKK